MCPPSTSDNPATQSRRHVWIVLLLLLTGWYLAAGPIVNLSKWHVEYDLNPAFEEAVALRSGHLDLPSRARYGPLQWPRI